MQSSFVTLNLVSELGEPPDETDDSGTVRARLGLAENTRILRAIFRPGQLVPGWDDLWGYAVGIPDEWDWSKSEDPPWPWSVTPDRDGSDLITHYILIRLRLADSPLAIERYYPPAAPTGAVLRGIDQAHDRRQVLRIWDARMLLDDIEILINQQGGRPTNRGKPQPAKVKIAKNGWKVRTSEPVLSWDKIAARVGAPSGKTLQRWIEVDRLHELDQS